MSLYGTFTNYGFIRDTVPSNLLNSLTDEIDSLDFSTAEPYNRNLAGNIEFEFKLSKYKDELETYVLQLCNEYTNQWDITHTTSNLSSDNLEMYVYWANFQKKHEFNPLHTHDGVFSFVIWLKIPFLLEDELKVSSVQRTNMPRPGMFSFVYTNVFGEVREAEIVSDKSAEGTILLFPSKINHQVYPFFTSNDYRITISGNIRRKQ